MSVSSENANIEEQQLRGDRITGDRYYAKAFMEREWDSMWTRVWHIAGITAQIPEPGDYVVHNFMDESVVVIRQEDGSIRAFYNACQHRGNRILVAEEGGTDELRCPYHGWGYDLAGVVRDVQDPEDFPRGNPCGKLRLKEVPCEVWDGFIWYTMNPDARPLQEYLHPIPQLLKNRNISDMMRVVWRTMRVRTNWKFSPDNFNEAYHVPTVHPQFKPIIDEDYKDTIFEMYPNGHNRMIEKGQPSLRSDTPNQVENPWAELLKQWDLDPEDFEGRARDGREALQHQKRKLAKEKGYSFYDDWSDDELTDYFHHTLFPNVTITGTPDGVHLYRTEPHPDDPNECTFDYWFFSPRLEGVDKVQTIVGERLLEVGEHEFLDYGNEISKDDTLLGAFLDQDLSVAVTQQQGFKSRGFDGAYLSGQESRVQRFHEVLNDFIEGRREG